MYVMSVILYYAQITTRLSRVPIERPNSLDKAVTSPVPEDGIHDVHVVLYEPASGKHPCFGSVNCDHAPEQIWLDGRAESAEGIGHDTCDQSSRSEIASGRKGGQSHGDKHEQPEIPPSREGVLADGNITATKGRDTLFVHLDHTFASLAVRGHWGAERRHIGLAAARKGQLVQGYV